MSDRQQELRRQHELLREHLVWLEREIVRESASATAAQPLPPVAQAQFQTMVFAADRSAVPVDADALLKDYAEEERHDPNATKRGCLLAFALALGLLFSGVATAYFVFYAHR